MMVKTKQQPGTQNTTKPPDERLGLVISKRKMPGLGRRLAGGCCCCCSLLKEPVEGNVRGEGVVDVVVGVEVETGIMVEGAVKFLLKTRTRPLATVFLFVSFFTDINMLLLNDVDDDNDGYKATHSYTNHFNKNMTKSNSLLLNKYVGLYI
ncbi:hypothetical protein FF38_03124 [Lucilia cuprina]|uniref:Uncharacterized protein n=1 Tax=Lucilia cuprina TaxID=7375 RepID=A0A0L0C8N1_LUCCU|nr:hypothetical protein FF38_03124 [Lucilia cuprina]